MKINKNGTKTNVKDGVQGFQRTTKGMEAPKPGAATTGAEARGTAGDLQTHLDGLRLMHERVMGRDNAAEDEPTIVDGSSAPIEHPDGCIEWRTPEGLLHRDDGPAVIINRRRNPDGTFPRETWTAPDGRVFERNSRDLLRLWYRNGVLHRDDGPAVVRAYSKDGLNPSHHTYEEWYQDGVLHRDGAPAVQERGYPPRWAYYKHGVLHRDDGPATNTGVGEWYTDVDGYTVRDTNLYRYVIDGEPVRNPIKLLQMGYGRYDPSYEDPEFYEPKNTGKAARRRRRSLVSLVREIPGALRGD